MAQQYTTVEVVILVDSCGDTATGADEAEAKERYEEQIQPLADCDGFRLVKLSVRIPLPETAVVEIEADAPALGAPVAAIA